VEESESGLWVAAIKKHGSKKLLEKREPARRTSEPACPERASLDPNGRATRDNEQTQDIA
jgi:hypothetical protein